MAWYRDSFTFTFTFYSFNIRFGSVCVTIVSSRVTVNNFFDVVKEPANLNNRVTNM
jgi:hypothetical protein